MTHPLTIRLWHGPRVYFTPWMISYRLTETFAKKSNTSAMSTGGQVASFAWILAVNLMANPIGVFGITNSYDEIDETEYPGVRHHKVTNKYGTFWVDPVYQHYNDIFLAYIRYAREKHEVRTVNCMQGGILYSDHIDDMSLEEFVEKHPE